MNMKTLNQFSGYWFLSYSSNGNFEICSYIAKVNGRKVYGYYDYKLKQYVEEPA